MSGWKAHMRLRRPRWHPAWAVYPLSAWRFVRVSTTYELVKWLLMGVPFCVGMMVGLYLMGVLTGLNWNQAVVAVCATALWVMLGPLFYVAPYVSFARWRASRMPLFEAIPVGFVIVFSASFAAAFSLSLIPLLSVGAAGSGELLMLLAPLLVSAILLGFSRLIDGRRGLDISSMPFGRPGSDFDPM
jgi:hypothetical protein